MDLQHLNRATSTLEAQASHLGKSLHQAQAFIQFCDHYRLPFINPEVATICYYITHFTTTFSSSKSVLNYINYISRVRFLHKQLGLGPEALDSFSVQCLL